MPAILERVEVKIKNGSLIELEEVMEILNANVAENELFTLANRICKANRGIKVNLCTIINAKSGKCSEDCKYCAQSGHYNTNVDVYPIVDERKIIETAKKNEFEGAHKFAIVTSGGVLSKSEFNKILEIIQRLKKDTNLDICASLGAMTFERAVMLKSEGLSMYHHNVETCSEYFGKICSTHSYEDKLVTIRNIMKAEIPICCGGIIGMGETLEQRIKMAFEIRNIGVKSVPINILNAIKGTPMENVKRLEPIEILKTIAFFRIIIPDASIRYAGGRDALGDLWREGFNAGIDAMMIGDYLTLKGNKISDDLKIIKNMGLEV